MSAPTKGTQASPPARVEPTSGGEAAAWMTQGDRQNAVDDIESIAVQLKELEALCAFLRDAPDASASQLQLALSVVALRLAELADVTGGHTLASVEMLAGTAATAHRGMRGVLERQT